MGGREYRGGEVSYGEGRGNIGGEHRGKGSDCQGGRGHELEGNARGWGELIKGEGGNTWRGEHIEGGIHREGGGNT